MPKKTVKPDTHPVVSVTEPVEVTYVEKVFQYNMLVVPDGAIDKKNPEIFIKPGSGYDKDIQKYINQGWELWDWNVDQKTVYFMFRK